MDPVWYPSKWKQGLKPGSATAFLKKWAPLNHIVFSGSAAAAGGLHHGGDAAGVAQHALARGAGLRPGPHKTVRFGPWCWSCLSPNFWWVDFLFVIQYLPHPEKKERTGAPL